MADAEITLAYSRTKGIVALATGEKYKWAQTALQEAGFQRGDHYVYQLPNTDHDAVRSTLTDLVHIARAHRTSMTTTSKGFLGDTASDIAGRLPGRWKAAIEIYAHPLWQGDVAEWLWDDGELARALATTRVTYAATLTNTSGTTLLLIDRPGPESDHLLGVLSPTRFTDGYQGPTIPRSISLPDTPTRAAQLIVERLLPAYERALHDLQAEAERQRADTPTSLPAPVAPPGRQQPPRR